VDSYSISPDLIRSRKDLLSSFLSRFFSESAQLVLDAAEYAEPDVTSADIEDVYKSGQGNHDAYKRLIERHQDAISRIMWRFSRDKLVHEELVQDVFVEAYLSLATYKMKAPFIHWLGKIATRVGYRYWKEQTRKSNRKNFTIQEWDRIPAEVPDKINGQEAAELAHKLLEQLPPRDRLVLTLRYLEGYDVAQTAYRTGWSRSMVKVQTIRAKRKIKKLFPNA
jgi:RNA polymerase sigma-70 factor (ECF subfamily)